MPFSHRQASGENSPAISRVAGKSTLDLLKPAIRVTSALAFCFDLVTTMAQRQPRETAQTQLLQGFMASSGKRGPWPALSCHHDPEAAGPLPQRGAWSRSPAGDGSDHFAMSRASWSTNWPPRAQLSPGADAQVRLGHALTLLQQGSRRFRPALACGYDSPGRFAARFKEEFGLTPHQYRTCPSSR